MAYSIVDREFVIRDDDKVLYRITAVLDSTADLDALGTDYAPGSMAMVVDKGAPSYMMNPSGEWKEV